MSDGADVNRISVWLKKTNNYAEPNYSDCTACVKATIDGKASVLQPLQFAGNLRQAQSLGERAEILQCLRNEEGGGPTF